MSVQIGAGGVVFSGVTWLGVPGSPTFVLRGSATIRVRNGEVSVTDDLDPAELPDADITPDEADPLPPDEPVKTDSVPEKVIE